MGKIEITICAARSLHNMQLIGMPDPFVRITTGDKKYKTKVIDNTLAPEWNETFRFHIADENSTQLRFEVYNKCTYNDDLFGTYTLSLGGLTRGIVKDQWYILDKSKTQAELRLRLLAVDFGSDPEPQDQWMVTTDINRDPVARAIEDGTWRPGQKMPPPPSGPPQVVTTTVVQSPPPPQVVVQQQQPQQQYVQAGPQPVLYSPVPPQQQQPQYAPQQQQPPQPFMVYNAPPPLQQYSPPPQQYAPPLQQYAPGYYPPPQQQQYAPGPYAPNGYPVAPNQPGYRY